MIQVPGVAQIRDQIIADIESKIGQTIPAMPKAFFRVLATAFAGVLSLLYRFGAWIYDQIFPQTAGIEALLRIGAQYGIVRTPAVAARLTALATGEAGTIIPVGTLWQFSGLVYSQLASEEITESGDTEITIQALTAGADTNRTEDDEVALVAPIAGVDREAVIISTVITGEDEETIEAYRSRILFRLARRPQGGSAADYVTWALEVAGVVKAFAFRTAPGEVTVYPLVALTGDRIPDVTKLGEIEAYLQDTARRPLCADVYAAAMTERVIDITVTTLQPQTVALQQAIETAWATWFLGRFPRQYADESNPTNFVSLSSLYREASGAGASLIEFELYIDDEVSPITYHELADDEIVRLGDVTWPA
jgi:uncharacterized phage protein gp47/JayE